MTTATTAPLPRQRPRPHAPRPARHRDPISSHEQDAEAREDWTAHCSGRRCTGACVVWRVKADRQARENRKAS